MSIPALEAAKRMRDLPPLERHMAIHAADNVVDRREMFLGRMVQTNRTRQRKLLAEKKTDG